MNIERTKPAVIGLTGIMGAGKSTVASLLAKKGAVIVDADKVVYELQQPGQLVLVRMVEILGPEILFSDGTLNRQRTADVIFSSDSKRYAIENIIHPAVKNHIIQRIKAGVPSDVFILDVPLLLEILPIELDGVIVVDSPEDLAIQRVMKSRGFSEADCKKRLARQPSRANLLKKADFVIHNYGTLDDLDRSSAEAWKKSVRNVITHK